MDHFVCCDHLTEMGEKPESQMSLCDTLALVSGGAEEEGKEKATLKADI